MRQLFAAGAGELGDGRVVFAWSPRGNFLAAAGNKRQVAIYDRNGKLLEQLHLPPAEVAASDPKQSCCLQLQWDASGELLAALPAGSSSVFVWVAATRELQQLTTEFRAQEVSSVSWARGSQTLAAGTSKGNLQLFALRERQRTPIVGKHTKRVLCGAWGDSGLLATGGADKTITLSDGGSGDTLRTWQLKGEPLEVAVARCKDDGGGMDGAISAITSKRVLYLLTHSDGGGSAAAAAAAAAAAPLELTFQEQYGAMQRHLWFGDGFVMVGFRTGRVVVVSSASKEVGTEVHSSQHLDVLADMAHCPALSRVAIGGGSTIKILDVGARIQEVPSETVEVPPGQLVDSLGWSRDGQVLTVSTNGGQLVSYLAALPTVFCAHGGRLAHLTSLAEVTVVDVLAQAPASKLQVACEPAFCAVGPDHVAVGMNNQVLYYSHSPARPTALTLRRDYLGAVSALWLGGAAAAVLVDGRLVVHPLEAPQGPHAAPDEHDAALPPAGTGQVVLCGGITEQFVVVGSAQGSLTHYLLPGLEQVNEYKHPGRGILRVWPQPDGVRCVFEDSKHALFLLNAVNDDAVRLPGLDAVVEAVIWDASDARVFVVSDGSALHAYLHVPPAATTGPGVALLSRAPLPATHAPVVVSNGAVTCRLKSGALDVIVLESHRALQGGDGLAAAGVAGGSSGAKALLARRFSQALKLQRMDEAWRCALALRSLDTWRQLGVAALEALDLSTATAAFRQLGDASMVLSLESLSGVEDRALLAGHALVLLGRDHDAAQESFLRSGRPLAALEMRRDLKHWPQALALARRLAPGAVAGVCRQHAAALEMAGDHAAAKQHYQEALDAAAGAPEAEQEELRRGCVAGLARTLLHLGDLAEGKAAALQADDPVLWKACAGILEAAGHLPKAAELYERCGMAEKAATIHIASKNFAAAAPLMAKVTSSKLQLAYARAKEAQGRWQEAAAAYEAAGDVAAAVKLHLERLDAAGRAAALVRKAGGGAAGAAEAVARRCLAAGDHRAAVEFLLLAGQMDQAFDVAASQGIMETFASLVGANVAAKGEVERIAAYYEERGELEQAGDMWARGEQRDRALQLYLRVGTAAAANKAISLVEASGGNEQLAAAVLAFIDGGGASDALGEGAREELRFRLHVALGRLADAGRSALELSRVEQEEGNYRAAHAKLLRAALQLRELGGRPPRELLSALLLLHSYVLVRSLVALEEHLGAARMLARVTRSISRFPKHVVPILTSAVIECQRAGLTATAFECAATLMRPEYRAQVSERYRKKVELVVRKPDRGEEPPPLLAPCAFCGLPGPEPDLQCVSCQSILPFDIATGNRMSLQDWCECPSCRFPCSSRAIRAILAAEGTCPMCCEKVAPDAVAKLPVADARRRAEEMGAAGAAAAAGAGAGGGGGALGG